MAKLRMVIGTFGAGKPNGYELVCPDGHVRSLPWLKRSIAFRHQEFAENEAHHRTHGCRVPLYGSNGWYMTGGQLALFYKPCPGGSHPVRAVYLGERKK